MAILKNGINGGFSGKVGTVVGTSWRGLEIIRSLPKKPTKFSDKQLANQMRMKLVQLFLKKMIEIVRIGFKDDSILPTAFNSAMSYNKKNAITGEYPDLRIDFEKVRISQGDLYLAPNLTFVADDDGLHFSWDKKLAENAEPKDQLLVVVWNELEQSSDYRLQAYRRDGQFSFVSDNPLKGIHIWAGFIRADRSMQSNSVYLGFVSY